MPKLSQTEDWVEAIRVFIRDTLGNKNWQIRKGERSSVMRSWVNNSLEQNIEN